MARSVRSYAVRFSGALGARPLQLELAHVRDDALRDVDAPGASCSSKMSASEPSKRSDQMTRPASASVSSAISRRRVPDGLHASRQHVADTEHLGHVARLVEAVAKRRRRQPRDHEQVGQPRQVADHVLGDQVAQEVVRRVARQVAKRQHRDRRPVADVPHPVRRDGGRQGPAARRGTRGPGRSMPLSWRSPRSSIVTPRPSVSWSRTAAEIDDFVRTAEHHQARGEVDAVAVEVDVVGHDVGQVDADSQMDLAVGVDDRRCHARFAPASPARTRRRRCALSNSTSIPSPSCLTIRPRRRGKIVAHDRRDEVAPPADRAFGVLLDQADRVDDVDEQHRAQPARRGARGWAAPRSGLSRAAADAGASGALQHQDDGHARPMLALYAPGFSGNRIAMSRARRAAPPTRPATRAPGGNRHEFEHPRAGCGSRRSPSDGEPFSRYCALLVFAHDAAYLRRPCDEIVALVGPAPEFVVVEPRRARAVSIASNGAGRRGDRLPAADARRSG